jgi:hypothetical protein
VFTNAALSVCAADGFYSDGVIVREQVGCVLLPQQTCPACATPCGTTINASGGQGIYLLDLETGTTVSDIGAVIIRFNPQGVPDGIRATLGANVYNKLTSPVDGLHQSSNAGALTFVGQTSADCGISGTTYPTLAEFEYNGTAFVATGDTQSVTVAAGDVSLGASAPGNTMMVIPKLTPSPSIINFEVVGPCSGTAWSMSVACPVLLTGFSSSVMAATSNAACLLAETTTYYNASLANTPGTVGLYDFVFADAYGNTPLAAGFYYAAGSITGSNEWFQVNASGVVIVLGVCAAPVSYNCVSGTCVNPGDGTGTYATLGECEAACSSPSVIGVFGYMEPCIGGTIDDYMGASVSLDEAVDVITTFGVDVFYVTGGGTCGGTTSTQSFTIEINEGETSSAFNACLFGAYFSSGATICGACITSCDNPNVDLGASECVY